MTYDGANLRLYMNGVQAGVPPRPVDEVRRRDRCASAATRPWGERFAGIIDDVRVYNRALTCGEITQDMNRPVSGGDSIARRSAASRRQRCDRRNHR